MKLDNIHLNATVARRLTGIAGWHNTTPDMMAKLILEEATREIWAHQGHAIEEMQRGLDYFNKHCR